MAQSIFSWLPDSGSTRDVEFAMLSAKFGDGYEQRAAKGINSKVIKWSLTFTRSQTEIKAISDFLDARLGYQSFQWTNPRNEVGSYTCKSYSVKRFENAPKIQQLSCEFVLVYDIL